MADEKTRVSGEQLDRLEPSNSSEPVLPTVNPAVKPEPPKEGLPAAVYIA